MGVELLSGESVAASWALMSAAGKGKTGKGACISLRARRAGAQHESVDQGAWSGGRRRRRKKNATSEGADELLCITNARLSAGELDWGEDSTPSYAMHRSFWRFNGECTRGSHSGFAK